MGLAPDITNPPSTLGFAALGVPAPLVDALATQGITSPFPIQSATLPDSLAGRDVLGRGRTGSGKTVAFALPLLTRISAMRGRPAPTRPRALVLVPTRELATQVQTAMAPLASALRLTTATVFGGVSQRPQVAALTRGVDVVIACPGRLEDLMRQGHIVLDQVMVSVIDEADHMADLGFLPGVRRILDATDRGGQRMLFSATLDNGVDVLVKRYLKDPVRHSVDHDVSTEPDIDHHVLTVDASHKSAVVTELASGLGRSLLFTRTKHSAQRLARDLTRSGVPAVDLHGNLSQGARDRNLAKFREGRVRVLVATDVAARGIHVDDVALVVHVDPPAEHKSFLHRSGRTARAGASGVVVTVQTPAQRREVAAMTRRAGITPTVVSVRPESAEVSNLTGPRAEHVEPSATPPAEANATSRQGRSGKGSGRRRGGDASVPSRSRGDRGPSRGSSSGRSAASGSTSERSSTSRPSQSSRSKGRRPGSSAATSSMSAADFSARGRRSR